MDSEILAHLLEANDIEAAKAKAQQLIYLHRNKYMPASASTVLLHEHVEPRTILEHQLAERDMTSQVLNSHTVDNKYNDNDTNVCPETKSRKYTECDSKNEKYSPCNPKWRGNNNTNHGKFSYRSRGNRPHGRDANNHQRRDQSYGYQYSQPQRGSYRR